MPLKQVFGLRNILFTFKTCHAEIVIDSKNDWIYFFKVRTIHFRVTQCLICYYRLLHVHKKNKSQK